MGRIPLAICVAAVLDNWTILGSKSPIPLCRVAQSHYGEVQEKKDQRNYDALGQAKAEWA